MISWCVQYAGVMHYKHAPSTGWFRGAFIRESHFTIRSLLFEYETRSALVASASTEQKNSEDHKPL